MYNMKVKWSNSNSRQIQKTKRKVARWQNGIMTRVSQKKSNVFEALTVAAHCFSITCIFDLQSMCMCDGETAS